MYTYGHWECNFEINFKEAASVLGVCPETIRHRCLSKQNKNYIVKFKSKKEK